MKKGQLSIFVLLGLAVILVVSLVLVATRDETAAARISAPSRFAAVVGEYQSCVDEVITDAVARQLAQGGWLHPVDGLFVMPATVHMGVRDRRSNVPDLQDMETDLADEVPLLIGPCVDNAVTTGINQGITLERADTLVSATYLDDRVVFAIESPLVLRSGDDSFTVPRFTALVRSQGTALRQAAEDIAFESARNDALALKPAIDSEHDTEVLALGEGLAVVSITKENQTFNVALETQAASPPQAPRLRLPSTITLQEGRGSVPLEVLAGNAPFTFTTNMPWLVATEAALSGDGALSGTYPARITVTGAAGLSDTVLIEVVVP